MFKSKSGNLWENKDDFLRKPKKYKIVPMEKSSEDSFISDFYDGKTDEDYPQTQLNSKVLGVVKDITSLKIFSKQMKNHRIDRNQLPLHKLDRTLLMQAKEILFNLKDLSKEWDNLRWNATDGEIDYKALFATMDQICELTNDYYEVVPNTRNTENAIPPLKRENNINKQLMIVNQLLEMEVSMKIILGAQQNAKTIHPMDYSFNCLNIKLMELEKNTIERDAILTYIQKSDRSIQDHNIEVYGIERKGEKERFQKWIDEGAERKLLWHGSKTMNFLGILKNGLKIAPPEAPATGYALGKGVYFSDAFAKSKMYVQGNKKIIILCEVALGKTKKVVTRKDLSETDFTKIEHDCIQGVGVNCPNANNDVVIPNGMVMPIGDMQPSPSDDKVFHWNEFCVYNESQVKMRYMVVL